MALAGGARDGGRAAGRPRRTWRSFILGLLLGALGTLGAIVAIGMPVAIAHRRDLPLERVYGDTAVGIASRLNGGNQQNPLAQNQRALTTGRYAYTGSCAECHGATGNGRGVFGQALYPPATDLTGGDAREKSDAQLFWITKNGLSFAGMPGFGDQYDDQAIWALVAYMRALQGGQAGPIPVPTPSAEHLSVADPAGNPAQRGASVYFAQGCQACHGAVGEAPGELGLGRGGRETAPAVRQGRPGMPAYGPDLITDAQLGDLEAYLNTFPNQRR